MITFDFYTPLEKIPKHDEEIIFISKHSSFATEYFEVQTGIIEYVWEELAENGEYNGNSICYDVNTPFEDDPTVRLNILISDHSGCYGFFDAVSYWNYPFDLEEK